VLHRRYGKLAEAMAAETDAPPAGDAAGAGTDARPGTRTARMPELVLVDGGKGQVSMAREVFSELGLPLSLIVGVEKGEGRKVGLEELVFADVSLGKASDPRNMMVSVVGYGSVTITASDEFQVSSDGIVFSPAIVIPEAQISTGLSLKVRYFPKKYSEEKLGSLTFTGGSGLSVVKEILVGRVGLTTAVEETTAANGFLYPNPTNGDVHVDLSWSDPQASYPVLVANSMGASVATLNAPAYSMDNTLTNIFTGLQPGVYFVIIKGQTTTWRTKLIRK